jgi:hypothetical protein
MDREVAAPARRGWPTVACSRDLLARGGARSRGQLACAVSRGAAAAATELASLRGRWVLQERRQEECMFVHDRFSLFLPTAGRLQPVFARGTGSGSRLLWPARAALAR